MSRVFDGTPYGFYGPSFQEYPARVTLMPVPMDMQNLHVSGNFAFSRHSVN